MITVRINNTPKASEIGFKAVFQAVTTNESFARQFRDAVKSTQAGNSQIFLNDYTSVQVCFSNIVQRLILLHSPGTTQHVEGPHVPTFHIPHHFQ